MSHKLAAVLFVIAFAGCPGPEPTPTGATCPDPDPMTLTYDSFGKAFMQAYCVDCHSSTLTTHAARNDAPFYHDFDTRLGVRENLGHVDRETGIGPAATNHFMPPDRCPSVAGGKEDTDCPQPTDEERTMLSEWLACEKLRPYSGE